MRMYKITFSPNKFYGELTWYGKATNSELAKSNLLLDWYRACTTRGLNLKRAEITEIHEEMVSWEPSMIYDD
jgi:hypothetical protein